jgi:hypothetical protein
MSHYPQSAFGMFPFIKNQKNKIKSTENKNNRLPNSWNHMNYFANYS